jgi:hypothetical protein
MGDEARMARVVARIDIEEMPTQRCLQFSYQNDIPFVVS